MRLALITLIIGLISVRWLPILPTFTISASLLVIGALLIPWRTYPIGLLLMGFAWGCLAAHSVLNDRINPLLDGQVLWLEGTVTGLPDVGDGVVRFQIKNNYAQDTQLPSLIRLSWYRGESVATGERWKLKVRLRYPRGTVNPHSFDYEAWLSAKHIGATGTVRSGERLSAATGLATWRYHLREKVLANSSKSQGAGLTALILGDGSGITKDQWQILQDTGTVHLMVISGQHISLLAGFLYFLVFGLARLGFWPIRLPWLPVACALALLGALSYGLLAGFDVPVQRACIMVALVLLWRLNYRTLGVVTPYLCSLALVLLIDPLVTLQAGFWLSFGAVAILLLGFTGRLAITNGWRSAINAQWIITIGLSPILLALLLPVSLTGPVANLIALPLVSFLIVPFALLGALLLPIPLVGSSLLLIAGYGLKLLFIILTFIAKLSPAWIAPTAPWWAYLLAGLGVVILLLPRGIPIKGIGIILCLPLLFPVVKELDQGHAVVTIFDVGQGLAVLIKTQNHNLLYDTGPAFGDFNVGERVIVPALKRGGVKTLDTLLVSHADFDHAGGAEAIVNYLAVNNLISGQPDKLPEVLQAKKCQSGARWNWDGVSFSLWQWSAANNGNDASCVLMIEANGERLLLTGDISSKAEKAWLAEHPNITVQWLLASHHGSKTASSRKFIQATKPNNVIISRGWLNAFKHPHPQILKRYQSMGVAVLDTAELGALQIELGKFSPVDKQRVIRRFWRK